MEPLITVSELMAEWDTPERPIILDARWYLTDESQGRREYQASHLPGSLFVDVATVASTPPRPDGVGGRHPLPDRDQLQSDLRQLGLSLDSPVVVLDQRASLGAARVWWVLRNAGLTRVRVLDGGFAAWVAAGGEVTDEPTPAPQPSDVVLDRDVMPTLDAAEVQRALDSGHQIVDVRASDRFAGRNESIDPIAGHIPGARNLPATDLQREDGTFRSADEIRSLLGGLGAGDAFSCGSGITASQALLAAETAGVTGMAIYPGSWSDWISDPDRPVATGE